ncbi:hypothetical protein D3C87_1549370 [compost metagenome]
MKKVLLSIALSVFSFNATAAGTTYVGATKKGEACWISVALENDNISFSYVGGGFGFTVDGSAIAAAIAAGETSIQVEGGDGPVSAKVVMNFNSDGELVSAYFKERMIIFSKTVNCLNLHKEQ